MRTRDVICRINGTDNTTKHKTVPLDAVIMYPSSTRYNDDNRSTSEAEVRYGVAIVPP